ncbi:YetF domain-containing protein [Sporosarcina sp. A2]|uniref:YetF domain-containing protein n=1 Tax=Sporosarcina sp. A2 TaxID=3393449 RepID=UPI003D7A1BDF
MEHTDFFKVDFWEMIIRTTVAFLVLLILARFMGKKQISQLTFFHYVTGITIGSIAANIAGESETPFMDGLVAMIWWAVLTIVMNYIAMKSKKARILLDDKPIIVIRNGEIEEEALGKARLDLNDLNMLLREQSIFSIKDVYFAIFEVNGTLSVMKRTGLENATKADVKASTKQPKYIPTEIISDGELILENLSELSLTEQWVDEQLKKQGINRVDQVFYAEIQGNGELHITKKVEKNN